MRMGPREWLMLFALSLLWGGSFFFVEVALDGLPPFTLVLGRVGLAAVILLGAVRLASHRLPRSAGIWFAFAVMALLNNAVPFSLITWGQVRIDSGLAAILNATTPLFTVLLAHLLTQDERLTAGRLAGVGLGIAGVALLVGPTALAGITGDLMGQLAVLGAAISYAGAGIFGRRFRELPTVVTSAGMLICATVLMAPLAVLERPWTRSPDTHMLAALGALAAFSTALAYLLYFRILAAAGATNVLLVTFLVPVTALLLGVLVLGESLAWTALAGMGLIFLGLAAVDGRPLRWLQGETRPNPNQSSPRR